MWVGEVEGRDDVEVDSELRREAGRVGVTTVWQNEAVMV